MGLDALDNALAVVELARRLGLPVAVNQVVLRGHHQVIPAFLDWLRSTSYGCACTTWSGIRP